MALSKLCPASFRRQEPLPKLKVEPLDTFALIVPGMLQLRQRSAKILEKHSFNRGVRPKKGFLAISRRVSRVISSPTVFFATTRSTGSIIKLVKIEHTPRMISCNFGLA